MQISLQLTFSLQQNTSIVFLGSSRTSLKHMPMAYTDPGVIRQNRKSEREMPLTSVLLEQLDDTVVSY